MLARISSAVIPVSTIETITLNDLLLIQIKKERDTQERNYLLHAILYRRCSTEKENIIVPEES